MTEYRADHEVVAAGDAGPDEELAAAGPCSLCDDEPAAWIARLPDDHTIRPWALASSWRVCDPCRAAATAGPLPRVGCQGVFLELTTEQAAQLSSRIRSATFTPLA